MGILTRNTIRHWLFGLLRSQGGKERIEEERKGVVMSLCEPRCMVCGAPLGRGAPFESDVRKSEVCSDKCFEIYMYDEDAQENDFIREEAIANENN